MQKIATNKLSIFIITLVLIAFSFFSFDVYAEGRNSITIQTKYESTTGKEILLDLYYIGEVKNGQIVLRDELKDVSIDFGNMSSSKMLKAAKILSESVKDKDILHSRKPINSNGTVKFEGLEDGVYLVAQKYDTDSVEYRMNPFIVMLPYHFQGQEIYNVVANAKQEIINPPNPGTTDPENPDPTEPDPEDPDNGGDNPNNPDDGGKNPPTEGTDYPTDGEDNPNTPKDPNGQDGPGKPKTGDTGILKPIGVLLIASALFIYINKEE